LKNTRIARLRQSKRVKQATKLLTVGLLVCPLAIGTIKALADEAETTPPVEQVEETPATTEEVAPVEETETSEPVQPEVVENAEVETPTNILPETQPPTVTEEAAATEAPVSEEPAQTFQEGVSVLSFDAEEASFSSLISQIETILDELNVQITVTIQRDKHNDLLVRLGSVQFARDETSVSERDKAFYDQWLPELQNLLNESNQLKADFESSQSEEIYTYYVTRNVLDDNGDIIDTLKWPEYAIKDSFVKVEAINWYGYYLLPGTPSEYPLTQITQNETQEFVFTYMSATSQKHRDPVKEEQISDLFDELGNLHWELKLKSDGTEFAEPLQELYYRMDSVSVSSGMFMQSHGYLAWYDYALSNLPAILADMKALAVEINAIQPEESFTAGELDLINARKVMAQYDSLDPYNYTEESWNKMIELDSQGEIYGASGALRTLCDYPDSQIIKGSKDKIQQNIYAWTDRLTEAMKVLVKVGSGETPLQQSIAKLKRTITSAESKLTESGYTEESMKALRQALQNAKDVLANANSTQAEIDEAQKALDLAIAGLVKAEDPNGNNTGNNGSNGAGNSTTDPNTSNNGTNNSTNNQTNSNSPNNNNSQNSNTTTTKPTGNNTNKDNLPQTGEQPTTNIVIAGLSLTMLSILAWFKRKKV
jgi:LPXTG-motif cell wall-anchored protein